MRIVIKPVPADRANVRVNAIARTLDANHDCAGALDGKVLRGGRTLFIPAAVIADITQRIGCSLRCAFVLRIAREGLRVFARLALKAQHRVDLALDAVVSNRRLTALFKGALFLRRPLLFVVIVAVTLRLFAAFLRGLFGAFKLTDARVQVVVQAVFHEALLSSRNALAQRSPRGLSGCAFGL